MRAPWKVTARLALFVAATLFFAGCGAATSPALPSHIVYRVDYPQFVDANQLADEATLVVEATVGGKPRVEMMFPTDLSGVSDPKLNPAAGAPRAGVTDKEGMVITVHSVTITKVYKGLIEPDDVIEVKQLGGTLDGTTYELEHVVPFRSGTKLLLFLATYPNSPASLLNPQQAQYAVDATGSFLPLGGNEISLSGLDLAALADR